MIKTQENEKSQELGQKIGWAREKVITEKKCSQFMAAQQKETDPQTLDTTDRRRSIENEIKSRTDHEDRYLKKKIKSAETLLKRNESGLDF